MFLKRSEDEERQGSCRTSPCWSWVILCGPGGSRIPGPDQTQVGGVLKRSEEQERQGSCRTGPGWSWVILCGPGGSRIQGSDRTQVGGVFEMV